MLLQVGPDILRHVAALGGAECTGPLLETSRSTLAAVWARKQKLSLRKLVWRNRLRTWLLRWALVAVVWLRLVACGQDLVQRYGLYGWGCDPAHYDADRDAWTVPGSLVVEWTAASWVVVGVAAALVRWTSAPASRGDPLVRQVVVLGSRGSLVLLFVGEWLPDPAGTVLLPCAWAWWALQFLSAVAGIDLLIPECWCAALGCALIRMMLTGFPSDVIARPEASAVLLVVAFFFLICLLVGWVRVFERAVRGSTHLGIACLLLWCLGWARICVQMGSAQWQDLPAGTYPRACSPCPRMEMGDSRHLLVPLTLAAHSWATRGRNESLALSPLLAQNPGPPGQGDRDLLYEHWVRGEWAPPATLTFAVLLVRSEADLAWLPLLAQVARTNGTLVGARYPSLAAKTTRVASTLPDHAIWMAPGFGHWDSFADLWQPQAPTLDRLVPVQPVCRGARGVLVCLFLLLAIGLVFACIPPSWVVYGM